MLLHHYLGTYGTVITFPVGAPGFRDRWQTELDNLGYPSAPGLRKIALINGALNGTTQGQACQVVLKMQSYLVFKNFFIKTPLIQVGAANVSFTGNYGNGCEVFDGWAKIWFNTNHRSAAAPASSKSYDIVPGGFSDSQQAIADDGEGFGRLLTIAGYYGLGTQTFFQLPLATHCFIPTYSALGISLANKDLSASVYNRNLVCSGETVFDSYYGPLTNEDHITLTPSNVVWIKNEIDGIPQPPSYDYASTYTIQLASGSEPLCTSSNVYNFLNVPAGGSITWSNKTFKVRHRLRYW